MAEEVVLMKGNEAIAHAAIRCGADGYFGYPITCLLYTSPSTRDRTRSRMPSSA